MGARKPPKSSSFSYSSSTEIIEDEDENAGSLRLFRVDFDTYRLAHHRKKLNNRLASSAGLPIFSAPYVHLHHFPDHR